MAIEVLKTRTTSYDVNTEGTEVQARGNRRGELVTMPAFAQAVADKRVFQAHIGLASTPVSFAKTAYDADQPQFVIDVPSGTSIMPLEILVSLEAEAGTLNEVIALASGTNVAAGTSTAVTPTNRYIPASGSAPASACSVYTLYTGNGTDPNAAPYFEFWRQVYAFSDAAGDPFKQYVWSAFSSPPPIIQGTGSLTLYIVGGTAPTGYVRVVWWEMGDSYIV